MSRTRLLSTEAIVLRRADFGEADRLLTVLTPESGKLRVLAKGARKITSRKAGHVELFTRVRLLLARGRTFDIVSQAETVEPHRALREDLMRGTLAHYVAELADQFAQEGSEDRALYELLAEALMWLCDCARPALAARYFEMRLLTLAGYRPQLFKCARTGAPVEARPGVAAPIAFSPIDGGVLSDRAAEHAREVVMLTPDGLALLRLLQLDTFEVVDALDLPDGAAAQAERALGRYLAYILERSLRSVPLVRQVSGMER